jgi:hypothetical protein
LKVGRQAIPTKRALRLGEPFALSAIASMSVLLATLAQRTTELRRMARLLSAPYLTSAGGVVGITAAIAVSKLSPSTVVATEGPRRRTVRERTTPLGAPRSPSIRANAATQRSIATALVLVAVIVAGSQGVERLINVPVTP